MNVCGRSFSAPELTRFLDVTWDVLVPDELSRMGSGPGYDGWHVTLCLAINDLVLEPFWERAPPKAGSRPMSYVECCGGYAGSPLGERDTRLPAPFACEPKAHQGLEPV